MNGKTAAAKGIEPGDPSRISQIKGRLKYCQEVAGNISVNMTAELDRILGSVPTPVSTDNAKCNSGSGSIDQLDELVSSLIETLDRLANQTQRLASV